MVGLDARIYATAAAAWLAGGDPWQASVLGFAFAASPPTLLPFAAFALLPGELTAAVWAIGSCLASVWLVRRLGLPIWWVRFPPLTSGALSGNPDVLVVALLVAGGPVAGTAAVFLKVYAVGPILGERRWRSLLIAAGALLLTAPFLPWSRFINEFGSVIATSLASQSAGLSAWDSTPLLIVALVALAILGPRRSGWLAVPAIWPHTQLHYAAIVLPELARSARRPVLIAAALYSLPIAGAPVVATVVVAIAALRNRSTAWRTTDPVRRN